MQRRIDELFWRVGHSIERRRVDCTGAHRVRRLDLGGPPDSTGADEGFLKVYVGNSGEEKWVRGDWQSNKSSADNCGAAYPVTPGGPKLFFPASVHSQSWFRTLLMNGGMSSNAANNISGASLSTIMSQATARCYLGGDPAPRGGGAQRRTDRRL